MSQTQVHNPHYLAIDQGGHSSRALVFDAQGNIVAQSRYAIGVQRPQPGWVEQDAEALLASVMSAVADVVRVVAQRGLKITAAGLATQRSTIVCWDKLSGRALSPIISWQDRRAHQWIQGFEEYQETVHRYTGLFITAHYGVSKLRWCLDHLSAVREAYEDHQLYWGPLASFLVFHLTRERRNLVDPANASRTLLWGIAKNDWDEQLLRLFDIPEEPLPRCVNTIDDFGSIEIEQMIIPLRVVMGDQPAALMAYKEPALDTAYINMGTGAFIQRPTGNQMSLVDKLLTGIVMRTVDGPLYDVECTVNGAGSALTKVEQQLGLDPQYAENCFTQWLEQSQQPPLFLNGVSGIGSPYWIPDFNSRFIGDGEPWEKVVAVAESILFLLQVNLEALQIASTPLHKLFLTGGLAMSNGLCQRLANLSGLPVFRPQELEATALGTAFVMAGCPDQWREHITGQWFYVEEDVSLRTRFQRWREAMEQSIAQHQVRISK